MVSINPTPPCGSKAGQVVKFGARHIKREQIDLIPSNVKRQEGKKNPTDSSDETRVGTPQTKWIQREPFDTFSAKVSRRKW
eukprot:scaffold56961_cov58-Attheya_sp.AAC.2